ncbi:MAG: family N-acetyltransferase [Devosia sp.]|nr:family N-acetyltransferase [Devosia sp.]
MSYDSTTAVVARRADTRPRTFAALRAADRTTALVFTREGFDAIADEWRDLEIAVRGAVLFQSAGWSRAIFDFEAQRGNSRFSPVIVTLREAGTLVAVLPLEKIRAAGQRLLVPLGHAYQQYTELLATPGLDAADALRRLVAAARAATPADAIKLFKVRADSLLHHALPATVVTVGDTMAAPYIDLSAHADFEAYLSTIRTKTRKNIRSGRNRLERIAPLTHEVGDTPEARGEAIARTLEGRAQRLRDQGLTSRAFHDRDFIEFCTGLATRTDPGLKVATFTLRHGDLPVSEQWGFVHNQRFYLFATTRDFTSSEESPGKLHMQSAIEAWFGMGLKQADLMVPAMPYKLTWATGTVAAADHVIPLTRTGWLVAHVWDRQVRPFAKRTMLALPPRLRGTLLKLVGRG